MTQANWSTVSERANAEARRLSGTSRWMTASSDTFPSALVIAATRATTTAIAKLKKIAARTVIPAAAPAAISTIRSGSAACSREPAAVPAKLPMPAAAAIAPSARVASQPPGKLGLHQERGEDGEEPAEAAQRRVGPQRQHDVRAHRTPPSAGDQDLSRCEDVRGHLPRWHVDVRGQAERKGADGREDRGGRVEQPFEAERPRDAGPDGAGDSGCGQPEHRQPGVRRGQRHRPRQHAGHDGGAQHVVRLRQHEDAERCRVEPEVVVVGGHDQCEHAPAEVAGGDRPPAAALQPVERGPDDRREDGERGHRDQQVQRDVAALGVGGRREEQGAGQGDGDHRVAGHVQGVDPQELGQSALAGAVGTAGRAYALGRRGGQLPERATATRATVTFGGTAPGSGGTCPAPGGSAGGTWPAPGGHGAAGGP